MPNGEDINNEIIIDGDEILTSVIYPLKNEILEIEGVGNENEVGLIEGVRVENEGVDSENEGVDNDVIPTELKVYCIRNPPIINYNHGISNWQSIGLGDLIIGSHDLHNVTKSCSKVINSIATFFTHSINQCHHK